MGGGGLGKLTGPAGWAERAQLWVEAAEEEGLACLDSRLGRFGLEEAHLPLCWLNPSLSRCGDAAGEGVLLRQHSRLCLLALRSQASGAAVAGITVLRPSPFLSLLFLRSMAILPR